MHIWQVSPTYSREIAGNPVIAPHLHKFHGIINGIDPDIWDPYNDKFIPVSRHIYRCFLFFSYIGPTMAQLSKLSPNIVAAYKLCTY